MKLRLALKVVVNLHVMPSIAPTFRRECASQESCRIRWVQFPCVFSGNPRLAFRSDCEFTCDAPWILILFQGKRASQEGFLRVATAVANFHSYPSQEESQILTKEQCTGDVGLFDSQFLTNRGAALVRKGNVRSCDSPFFKTHVTPKGWDVKGGIPQNASWRLGCAEARQTLKHDRAIPKTTAVQGHTKEMQWNWP